MKRNALIFLLMLSLYFCCRIPVLAAKSGSSNTSGSAAESPCRYAGDHQGECTACMGDGKSGVWTAVGCLQTGIEAGQNNFVTSLLKFGAGAAGGIAFLLIVIGGFQIVMSAGNPEKLNEGKELVVAAIVGLLFIIFSVFLLRLIGVELLGIPGFE